MLLGEGGFEGMFKMKNEPMLNIQYSVGLIKGSGCVTTGRTVGNGDGC